MKLIAVEPEFPHEQVVVCQDRDSGLVAVIAVHDTTLGPAAGGCRMWPYPTPEAAWDDVLRLSVAMTWKNALAGLALGGGKSVIVGDPHTDQSPELLHAYASCVQELGGRYWVAEDVGVGVEAVRAIAEVTDYTFGVDTGDPSPWTALGGLMGILAAVEHRTGSDDISGLGVAVQGVGHVGSNLVRLLVERGARVVVSDIDQTAVQRVVAEHGVEATGVDEIYDAEVEVLAPCALGGSLHDETIPRLKASIVCGLANNQLEKASGGRLLQDRGILYVPDFVVNSGGMLAVSGPIFGRVDSEEAIRPPVLGIRDRVAAILDRSTQSGVPPSDVAYQMARQAVLAGR